MGGRWDPAADGGSGGWVTDGVHSPSIDTGDPNSEFYLEPDGNGGRINMGAYGNTAEASRSHVPGHVLTVLSVPADGVAITGDKPGTTSYTATCDDQQVVTLTAPATVGGGSEKAHNFLYWTVDNAPRTYGETELQVTMESDHIAVAIYDWRLAGDNNGDCSVDILDMIFVRNRLTESCSESAP